MSQLTAPHDTTPGTGAAATAAGLTPDGAGAAALSHEELLRGLAEAVGTKIAPAAERIDRDSTFPREQLRSLADAGLGALLMPRELGGQDAPASLYARAVEEVSAACGSTSTVFMTQLHAAHPIHVAGTPQQQQRWVPALASARAVGSIALTEPDSGSDVASMRTVARQDGDDWVVNGSKIFISNGDVADVVVLFATIDTSLGKDGITAFLVDTAAVDGFESGRPMKKLGQKGASTVALSFTDCRLPRSAVLGEIGRGYHLLLDSVKTSRISAAAQGVGFAQGAFETTARWCSEQGLLSARNRSAQDLQFALARLRSEIAAGRALLASVCDLVDTGSAEAGAAVSMAKMHCTTLGVRVAAECIELLGPDGDRTDLGVERRLRDAKIAEIYDGTNQVQSMLVARDLRLALER